MRERESNKEIHRAKERERVIHEKTETGDRGKERESDSRYQCIWIRLQAKIIFVELPLIPLVLASHYSGGKKV